MQIKLEIRDWGNRGQIRLDLGETGNVGRNKVKKKLEDCKYLFLVLNFYHDFLIKFLLNIQARGRGWIDLIGI